MRSRRAALFTDLKDALVAALVLAPPVVGCGGEEGARIDDDPNFVPVPCADGEANFLADTSPAMPVDYAELRDTTQDEAGNLVLGERIASVGTPCSGATDRTACEAAMDPVVESSGFPYGVARDFGISAHLQFTRGDEVGVVSTRDDLLAYLSPIDTPGDAMLLAMASRFDLTCTRGGALVTEEGILVQAYTYPGCDGRKRHVIAIAPDGEFVSTASTVEKEADPNCAVGRRPPGLRPRRATRHRDAAGRYLARAAELEAASVPAFAHLLAELRHHGAPRALCRSAARAVADEVRHARVVGALARRYGSVPVRPSVSRGPIRDLEALAADNAVEGCVRETLGAVAAAFQARRARDAAVRRAYARIARDEARHAELAWQIARWVEPRLSPEARARLRDVRAAAVAELKKELEAEPAERVRAALGVPNRAESLAMTERLERSLWSS